MNLPNGMTEDEVLVTIDKVISKLSYKFIFGCYTYDDIKQEAFIIALEGLEHYRPDLPLENFLWVHVKNRLCNLKRDKYIRLDKPCATCPLKAYIKKGDLCKIYENKGDCELYAAWKSRNEAKKNVISPISMSVLQHSDNSPYTANCATEDLYNKELIALIDKHMTMDIRPFWLQLKAGMKLHIEDLRRIQERVREIMEENGVEENW
jgi:hypothetical protein